MSGALPLSPAGWARKASASPVALLVCLACLVLPWVNPYAGGPSSSVQPWLVSAGCVALASAIQASGRLQPGVPLGLALVTAWAIVTSGLDPDTSALAGACLLVFLAARMAAGG
ncbi:MAG TPA: hypothetical protein VKD22_16170, partial [Ramlibacter sp.]|nr:hypothetical protein [Ramlibacter sp.]